MKYGVNRQILLITAGAVWIIAGANILRIGIVTWLNTSQDWMFWCSEDFIINIPSESSKRKNAGIVRSPFSM